MVILCALLHLNQHTEQLQNHASYPSPAAYESVTRFETQICALLQLLLHTKSVFPAEGICVIFPTIRSFYELFELTTLNTSDNILFQQKKYTRVFGTYAHDESDSANSCYILLGRSRYGKFRTVVSSHEGRDPVRVRAPVL